MKIRQKNINDIYLKLLIFNWLIFIKILSIKWVISEIFHYHRVIYISSPVAAKNKSDYSPQSMQFISFYPPLSNLKIGF